MAVFASKWLAEGKARRGAALQQSHMPSFGEKNQERISSEPEKPAKGAFEGLTGELHKHSEFFLSPVTELSEDEKARSAGFLPLLSGEVYMRQISPYSHIFIQLKEDGKWYAWRETFDTRGRQVKGDSGNLLRTVRRSVNVKMRASNVNMFDLALIEASKYADHKLMN